MRESCSLQGGLGNASQLSCPVSRDLRRGNRPLEVWIGSEQGAAGGEEGLRNGLAGPLVRECEWRLFMAHRLPLTASWGKNWGGGCGLGGRVEAGRPMRRPQRQSGESWRTGPGWGGVAEGRRLKGY